MSLVEVDVEVDVTRIPEGVRRLIRDAEQRIDEWMTAQGPSSRYGFVASDFERAYATLRFIAERDLTLGSSLCEWGSGFGVVTVMASMLDYEACGIEIQGDLVHAAEELARDYESPARFVQGSFIPTGGEWLTDPMEELSWLDTTGPDGYEELDLDPEDFDVIYAYPWPGEEVVIRDLFETYAAVGALLVTYNGVESMRVLRKTGDAPGPRSSWDEIPDEELEDSDPEE